MADLVVTVPKNLWFDWLGEGDAAGEPDTGEEWGFYVGWRRPPIQQYDRLYIVAWGRLRGYSLVTRVATTERGYAICRRGGAEAITIPAPIPGFRGWRERWWPLHTERPFPNWKTAGTPREAKPDGPLFETARGGAG